LDERYELVEVIGRGAMGEVWAARDKRLDRPVAVKLMSSPIAFDDATRLRFETEIRAAARLNHPNVVSVYDSGEDDAVPFLVMELLPGRTLADEITEGPLRPERARAVGVEVLAALAASHRAGILHRDIKPGNVLLTALGTAKVADFGIAKSIEGDDLTATGMVLGTAAYLAPERLAGHPATVESDVYAVGAMLYEALAGDKPFNADTPLAMLRAIENHEPRPLAQAVPDLDHSFAAAVQRAMAKDPAERFASAATMAEALCAEAASGAHQEATAAVGPFAPTEVLTPLLAARPGDETPAPTASFPGPTHRRRTWQTGRSKRAVIAGIAAAALLVVLFLIVVRPDTSPSADAPQPTLVATTSTPALPEPLADAIDELEGAVRS
jgi:serine/threonine-protein kinase